MTAVFTGAPRPSAVTSSVGQLLIPFSLPEKVGVRYYGKEALTTGHLLTMVGNAKRIAGHMSSESAMRSQYPAIYALMKDELRDRETLRTRESFLATYGYMERILQEIYGDRHEELLPKLVRVDIPFGNAAKKVSRRKHIGFNDLEFINILYNQDVDAVFRGIVTYKKTPYKVTENATKVRRDVKGELWAPYLTASAQTMKRSSCRPNATGLFKVFQAIVFEIASKL